jgi:hypothetical protein
MNAVLEMGLFREWVLQNEELESWNLTRPIPGCILCGGRHGAENN